jgi:hypothetical protein
MQRARKSGRRRPVNPSDVAKLGTLHSDDSPTRFLRTSVIRSDNALNGGQRSYRSALNHGLPCRKGSEYAVVDFMDGSSVATKEYNQDK